MITADAAVEVLYSVLYTDPYLPRAYWTVTAYRDDPLLKSSNSEFKLDPVLNKPKTQVGPAAG
jgi:hypothetical protein